MWSLWLKKHICELIILAFCLGMCGVVMAFNFSADKAVPAGLSYTDGVNSDTDGAMKINLNTATAEELETLPRIGPAIAQRIVDYRAQIESFTSLDQLLEVRGIGQTVFEEVRPYLSLS